MNMTEIQWMSAAPFWPQAASNGATAAQPTILRFVNDDFMSEFMTVMENQPERLVDYQAWYETWRKPLPQPDPVQALPPVLRALARRRSNGQRTVASTQPAVKDENPLKLFQPAHQRYYLATACLVCRQPGLPDRRIDSGKGEQAAFVMRRLLPKKDKTITAQAATQATGAKETSLPRWGCPSPGAQDASPFLASEVSTSTSISTPDGECDEYAFVQGSDGPAWQIVPNGSQKVDGEELLPFFPVSYAQADGYPRRLLAGLVPVGRREAYLGAPKAGERGLSGQANVSGAVSQTSAPDARLDALLAKTFTGPWENLIDMATNTCAKLTYADNNPVNDPDSHTIETVRDQVYATRVQIQETSWYLLADLLQFLTDNQVSDALKAFGTHPIQQPALQAIVNILRLVSLPSGVPAGEASLGDALLKMQKPGQVALLEQADRSYDPSEPGNWPNIIFPLVDMDVLPDSSPNKYVSSLTVAGAPASSVPITNSDEIRALADQYKNWIQDHFHTPLLSALPTPSAKARLAPIPLAAQTPAKIDDPGWFVIRCVFERPNCLPAITAQLSEPTPPFQLAGFFDPDAPARPIRIALPIDTTPAGLRKFDKNTAFMISDVLCGQIKRAKGLGLVDLVLSVLPWPFHKNLDLPDNGPCENNIGLICSLSIPIITICALILLMIIVSLFDIIFKWMPYFILCFPLPNFSGKKGTG